jgi:hypothetical protein
LVLGHKSDEARDPFIKIEKPFLLDDLFCFCYEDFVDTETPFGIIIPLLIRSLSSVVGDLAPTPLDRSITANMNMPSPSSLQFVIPLLLAVSSLERCQGSWISQSVSGGGHIASLSLDTEHDQIMAVGTAFQEGFWNMTVDSADGDDNGVSCFVATLDITQEDNQARLVLREPNICTAVVALPRRGLGKGVVMGYDQLKGGGFQGDGLQPKLVEINTFAMLLSQGLTSVVQDTTRVAYPIAAVSDDDDDLFMVVQQTTILPTIVALEDDPLASILQLQQEVEGGSVDWVPAVQKVITMTGEVQWITPIATEDGYSVLTSVVYMPSREILWVAGYSNGQGSAVGAGYSSQDWDGFLTKVDPETGAIEEEEGVSADHSIRIETQPHMNDYVHAICVSGDKIYVVGTTEGTMQGDIAGGAFMVKYDIDSRQPLWKRQIPGKVEGKLCGVFEDDVVYIGGNVAAGLSIEEGVKSASLQDVFVSQLSASDGTVSWTRQFGSHRDDSLESMVVDKDGNAVVGGNSLVHAYVPSSLFSPVNDIFILSLDKLNGDHQELVHDDTIAQTKTDEEKPNLVVVFAVVIPVVIALILIACECRRRVNSEVDASHDPGDDLDLTEGAKSEARVV